MIRDNDLNGKLFLMLYRFLRVSQRYSHVHWALVRAHLVTSAMIGRTRLITVSNSVEWHYPKQVNTLRSVNRTQSPSSLPTGSVNAITTTTPAAALTSPLFTSCSAWQRSCHRTMPSPAVGPPLHKFCWTAAAATEVGARSQDHIFSLCLISISSKQRC